MTTKQRLTIRDIDIRARLNEISGYEGDQLTEVIRAEAAALQTEYRDVSVKLSAAVAAEPDRVVAIDDAESRELRRLTRQADCGAIFAAVLNKGVTDGETRELQQHHGLAPNQVPLGMLRGDTPATIEAAVTPAPGQVDQVSHEIIPWVFPQSCAPFLGIDMPTVPTGDAVFPVLTKKLDVRTPAENADADETTGSFSASVLTPSRIQASFFYSREDRARFAGMDTSLRENLSDGLSDGLDDRILSGTKGLFTGTVLSNHAAGGVTTWASYVSSLGYSRVDGRFAGGAGDLRIVVGSGTYAHAGSVYRANETDVTALDRLMAITGGVKVSSHVPAVSRRTNRIAVIRRGMRRDMRWRRSGKESRSSRTR